jgi:ABC-2 type transport system ATP-binding protein
MQLHTVSGDRRGGGGRVTARQVIAVREATKRYGDEVAVDSLTLEVQAGTTLGVIGPSGSGKTTAVRLMTGIATPTSGEVEVFGTSPARFTAAERGRIGYMPQLGVLDPNLTLQENLEFVASLYGLPVRRRRRLREALRLVGLEGDARKLLRNASGGMQRRLSLAATLLHEPELIFLDEPTAGIDPVLRRSMWEEFGRLSSQGRTLVVTTQYVGEAAYCDRVAVLAGGRLLAVDTPVGLRRRAFGGELVDLVAAHRLEGELPDALASVDGVLGVERTGVEGRAVRLLVEDASVALPRVQREVERRGGTVASAEPHVPSYDDVFVSLVERSRAAATPGTVR